MHSLFAGMPESVVPAAVGGDHRSPAWPGWLGTSVLVLANALQVVLTWWVLRTAVAPTSLRRPARIRVLQVVVLIAANTLQVSLTWWVYRTVTARGDGPPPAIRRFSSSASRQLGGK